jgi:hypothetical protein
MSHGVLKNAKLAVLTVAALLGSSAAASAAMPGFMLTASTPRVSFYTRGEKVDVAKVEASLTRIEGELGTTLTGHASYYRYSSAQEVAAGTGHYAAGVTFAGEVHSTSACHDHELVHLVAAQMGNPGRFFQEGLAVALGDESRGLRQAAKKALAGGQPVTRWVARFDGQDPDAAYAVAGTFVRDLIETHGMEKVRALFRASRSEADAPRAFAATFGQGLEEALAAWRADVLA